MSYSNKGFEPSTCSVGTQTVQNVPVWAGRKNIKKNSTKLAVRVTSTKPLGVISKLPVASVALRNKFQILQDLREESTWR